MSQVMQAETITRQQVIDLITSLPSDRLVSVYDFALFIKTHPFESTAERDIFGESEDEIRADKDRWDRQFAASRDQLRVMAREAAAEYRAGQSKPMEFTPEGRLAR